MATIAVSAGSGLRDWGIALKPPGGSALWPVFLGGRIACRMFREQEKAERRGAKGKVQEHLSPFQQRKKPLATLSPVPFSSPFP